MKHQEIAILRQVVDIYDLYIQKVGHNEHTTRLLENAHHILNTEAERGDRRYRALKVAIGALEQAIKNCEANGWDCEVPSDAIAEIETILSEVEAK